MGNPLKIDVHMHLYKTRDDGLAAIDGYHIWEYGEKPDVRFGDLGGNIDDALGAMEASGITKAVVVNLYSAKVAKAEAIAELSVGLSDAERTLAIDKIESAQIKNFKDFNMWCCGAVKNYPQLIPYICADGGALPGDLGAIHVRDMVENHGARGVKMHGAIQGYNMSDEIMWPTYRMCRELGIPIIAHSGPDLDNAHYAEPKAFARMLNEFPELTVVVAHMGGGTWSQALELAEAYPNAYFDCCEIIEWTGGTNAPSDRQLARLIKDIGPERVFMGSDFPWYDLQHTVERVLDLPILSQEEKEGIMGANAETILGL